MTAQLTPSLKIEKPTASQPLCFLSIRQCRFYAHFGWDDTERRFKQALDIDLWISFSKLPPACQTDHLKDTICYKEVLDFIGQFLKDQKIRLLEKLASSLYEEIKRKFPQIHSFAFQITKVNPPVEVIKQGASIFFGDAIPFSNPGTSSGVSQ